MSLSLEQLVLHSNLVSVVFEKTSFEVIERFTSKRAGAMEISTPLQVELEESNGVLRGLKATLEGGMKGYVFSEDDEPGESAQLDEEDVVFDARFVIVGKFEFKSVEVQASEFEKLMSKYHKAVGRVLMNQIYPYVRHHLRIRLTESGFKGIEPPVSVMTDDEEYDFNKMTTQKKSRTSKKKKSSK